MWESITGLITEIRTCEEHGATTSAIVMAYICIDTMTYLSMQDGQERQERNEFINWVDTYLQCHVAQPYQYSGIDVYGARCAVLHTYGIRADFHRRNPDAKEYGYHDGGLHAYDPVINPNLVMIGTASFLNDVVHAVSDFIDECGNNEALRLRVEARLPGLLLTIPR